MMNEDSFLDSYMESYIGNWSEGPYVPEAEEAEDNWWADRWEDDADEPIDLPDDYYDEPDNDPYYGWEE
jgi:hypothetical protein